MKKAAMLLAFCATSAGAQSTGGLSYKGWALGIPFDSAQKLALRDIRAPLSCEGIGDAPLRCTGISGKMSGGMVTIEMSSPPRKVISIGLMQPLGAHSSADSVKRALTRLWGKPLDLTAMTRKAGRQYPTKLPLGMWRQNGTIGSVSEMTVIGGRKISINLSGPEHMRNQMVEAYKRNGLSDDSIRVLMKRVPRLR